MGDHIRLCDHCIDAIRSRGEKVFVLESLETCEQYADVDETTCEWCEESLTTDQLFDCVF